MASQTKPNVPAALVELFSDRSNICFNATSGLKAREKSTIAVATALCAVQRKGTVFISQTSHRAVATVTSGRYRRSRLGKANLPSSEPSLHELDFRGHIPIFARSFHRFAARDRRILPANICASFLDQRGALASDCFNIPTDRPKTNPGPPRTKKWTWSGIIT